jgi:hypothetical protein
MSVHMRRQSDLLPARLCLLASVITAATVLKAAGFSAVLAAVIALVAGAGAVEIACRLTTPFPAPRIRVGVVVVILAYVTIVVQAVPYPPLTAVVVALGTAAGAAEIARRLTGMRYLPVRLTG